MTNNNLTLHITFTSNNIFTNLIHNSKHKIACTSSGQLQFKGTTKTSLVAAETIAIFLVGKILGHTVLEAIHSLIIIIKGVSLFKEGLIRKLRSFPLPMDIISIQHYIITPHNGCKLPKKRRK